jgi:hypothetical protein
MAHIEKIKNVTIFNDLTNSPISWIQNTRLSFVPDEVRVRQITYHGPPTGDGAFMIWSSVTNDYIGSFSVAEATGFTSVAVNVTPNTVIKLLPNSINQSLTFQIHSINGSGVPFASNNLTGQIMINLDFIRYVR